MNPQLLYYFGSRTSQTNDLKKENYDQALTYLGSASLILQTTISLKVFLDVSLLYTYYKAFLPQKYVLLDVLVSLIQHSFWEPVFSQFVKPKFRPKKIEMVLRHSYEQKSCFYWDLIRNMKTKHEMLCEQRISNSNNKKNKRIKVGISIKSIPTCFLSTLKCAAVWLHFLLWS